MSTFEEAVDKVIKVALLRSHPVGSVYLTLEDSNPSSIFGGSWEKVGSGKCLWLADESHEAGTEISAGLPNITGSCAWAVNGIPETAYSTQKTAYRKMSGALSVAKDGGAYGCIGSSGDDASAANAAVSLDASQSNALYGASKTVQPPAYVVIAWRRVA